MREDIRAAIEATIGEGNPVMKAWGDPPRSTRATRRRVAAARGLIRDFLQNLLGDGDGDLSAAELLRELEE